MTHALLMLAFKKLKSRKSERCSFVILCNSAKDYLKTVNNQALHTLIKKFFLWLVLFYALLYNFKPLGINLFFFCACFREMRHRSFVGTIFVIYVFFFFFVFLYFDMCVCNIELENSVNVFDEM